MKLIFQIFFVLMLNTITFSQCTNSALADNNYDNRLDILDVISMVDLIISGNSLENFQIELNDINSDSIIDILDIIKLVNKILFPEPEQIFISTIESSLVNVNIRWEISNSPNFYMYKIYYSYQDSLIGREIIYESLERVINEADISGLSLYNDKWFWVDVVDYWGCSKESQSYKINNVEKTFELDHNGNVIHSEMIIEDFESSSSCVQCHENHVQEWSESRHAHSMKDPLFFSMWNDEQQRHPATGERFCVQCHSPAAFVTGEDLSGFETVEEFHLSSLPDQIKEGVTCTVCHTATGLSSTYFASDDLSPNVEYHLYPGENIFFGPVENPQESMYHQSGYSPMFKRSEMCLPCHDLVMRGVEAEITFTEWNRIPGFAMSGGATCQNCHMPQKEDGTHDHSFVGVDLDLSYPIGEAPQHNQVKSMLESAVNLEFGAPGYELVANLNQGETLYIPITVTSLTAHNIPSGTSFSREAWIEALVEHDGEIIYSSGLIDSNTSILDINEEDLLLFTSFFLDEFSDTTMAITETHDIINETLPALGTRYHLYQVSLPEGIIGNIEVKIRMRFRALTPSLLIDNHPEMLENQPVFDMASISAQINLTGE